MSSGEKMQSVKEGEAESGLRSQQPMEQQKNVQGEGVSTAQQTEGQRFTSLGSGSQQQQSPMQQQQQLASQPQQSLGTSQGQQPLTGQGAVGQTPLSQQVPPGSQVAGTAQQGLAQGLGQGVGQGLQSTGQPIGGQQPIGQQVGQQGLGQQGLGQQGLVQQGLGQQAPGQQGLAQQGVVQQVVPPGVGHTGIHHQVATFAEVSIDDPLYEPQQRIANMQEAHKRAFLKPYTLAMFGNQKVQSNDPFGSIWRLDQYRGARIVCFPIPKGPPSTLGHPGTMTGLMPGQQTGTGTMTGGVREMASATATTIAHPIESGKAHQQLYGQGQQQTMGPQQSLVGQQTLGSQQNIGLPSSGSQQSMGSQQQPIQGPGIQPLEQQQQFVHPIAPSQGLARPVEQGSSTRYQKGVLITNMDLEIEPTSQVWGLNVPADEITPNFWENKSARIAGPVNLGELLFMNTSQIPSASSRAATASLIDKPARHLFIFGATSHYPLLIVERDLKPVRKHIKVYSSDLSVFCKIEGSTSLLRRKITVLGPDEETPIFTVKQKGLLNLKNFPLTRETNDEGNYIVFRQKKPVGCITARYIAPTTLPNAGVAEGPTSMAYDVFFPTGAKWAHKAALMITALYFDYLWSD